MNYTHKKKNIGFIWWPFDFFAVKGLTFHLFMLKTTVSVVPFALIALVWTSRVYPMNFRRTATLFSLQDKACMAAPWLGDMIKTPFIPPSNRRGHRFPNKLYYRDRLKEEAGWSLESKENTLSLSLMPSGIYSVGKSAYILKKGEDGPLYRTIKDSGWDFRISRRQKSINQWLGVKLVEETEADGEGNLVISLNGSYTVAVNH